MSISVVLPVHNDAAYLPYALYSLRHAPINELIVLLDRCTDNSAAILWDFIHRFKPQFRIVRAAINFNLIKNAFKNRIAGAFDVAFNLASCDYIYSMAADIITDAEIYDVDLFTDAFAWLSHIAQYDLISFRYDNYDLHARRVLHEGYVNFLNRLPFVYRCKYGKFSGHFAVKRSVWRRLRFKDVTSPDLDFFNRAYDAGYKHKFYGCFDIYHLRTGLNVSRQIQQGRHRAAVNSNVLKVLAHSLFTFKPRVLASYLSAVYRGKTK